MLPALRSAQVLRVLRCASTAAGQQAQQRTALIFRKVGDPGKETWSRSRKWGNRLCEVLSE